MEYITKKDLIDCSTPDEFCFSLCCMECKTVWKKYTNSFFQSGEKNRKMKIGRLFMIRFMTGKRI